jgi:hypothetical protein
MTNLGFLELRLHDWGKARATLEGALAWAREAEDLQGLVINGVNLAFAYLRSGDPDRTPPLIADALRIALNIESLPAQLSAVGTEGERLLATGDRKTGLAFLGLAFHHPASSSDIQGDVQMGLDYWGPKLGMTDGEVKAGMQAGKDLDLAQTAARILARAT